MVVLVLTFDRVMVFAELVVDTTCEGNVIEVGESATAVRDPARLTVCGELLPLSVMLTAAVAVPETVGLKVTLTVQVAPMLSVAPEQLSVSANSEAFVPVSETLLTTRETRFVFSRVKDCDAEDCPIAGLLKVRARVEGHPDDGQVRVLRMSGWRAFWVKSNESVVSLALASREVSGGRPKSSSTNFKIDESSYCVCDTYPVLA